MKKISIIFIIIWVILIVSCKTANAPISQSNQSTGTHKKITYLDKLYLGCFNITNLPNKKFALPHKNKSTINNLAVVYFNIVNTLDDTIKFKEGYCDQERISCNLKDDNPTYVLGKFDTLEVEWVYHFEGKHNRTTLHHKFTNTRTKADIDFNIRVFD